MNPIHILKFIFIKVSINPLNVEVNPIRHLLAFVGARHIVHVSRIRVKILFISRQSLTLRLFSSVFKTKTEQIFILYFILSILQVQSKERYIVYETASVSG